MMNMIEMAKFTLGVLIGGISGSVIANYELTKNNPSYNSKRLIDLDKNILNKYDCTKFSNVQDINVAIKEVDNKLQNLIRYRTDICLHNFIDKSGYFYDIYLSKTKCKCVYCTICHTTQSKWGNYICLEHKDNPDVDDYIIYTLKKYN